MLEFNAKRAKKVTKKALDKKIKKAKKAKDAARIKVMGVIKENALAGEYIAKVTFQFAENLRVESLLELAGELVKMGYEVSFDDDPRRYWCFHICWNT